MGIAGLLIPLVSVSAVLTLLPALLSSIGPRVDYPRIRKEGTASRGWSAWARLVVRHRVIATAVAVGVLALLIIPVFGLKIGQSGIDSLARSGAAVRRPADPHRRRRRHRGPHPHRGARAREQGSTPRLMRPAASTESSWPSSAPSSGDNAVVDVLPTNATVDSDGTAVVDDVRTAVEHAVGGDVGVTGLGASVEDYFSAVYDKLPYVLALIALITFVLLVRTFRSVLLPLKAVLLNLISHGGRLRLGRVLLAARPRVRRDLQRVRPPAPSTSGCPW